MKKYFASAVAGLCVAGIAVGPGLATQPGAAVHNENANANACWGQDRSFYASEKFFGDNMDIKQSFPGGVGVERAAWVATYCDAHGPAQ